MFAALSSRRAIAITAVLLAVILLTPLGASARDSHTRIALGPAYHVRYGTSYTVYAGLGSKRDGSVDVDQFQPRHLTIHVGDTVTFVVLGFHNIAFESGYPPLIIPAMINGRRVMIVNPAVSVPSLPMTRAYYGGVKKSGILPSNVNTWTVQPLVAGTFRYVCQIHPGMNGTITVLPRMDFADTPAQAMARARSEAAFEAQDAALALAQQRWSYYPARTGGAIWRIAAGYGLRQTAVERFWPSHLTIHVGDTVMWELRDDIEPHTISINARPNQPPFTPAQTGSGMVLVANPYLFAPANGQVVSGQFYYNSGFLPPHSVFALRFTRTGTYRYECQIHAGMDGVITVVPPGARVGPTSF